MNLKVKLHQAHSSEETIQAANARIAAESGGKRWFGDCIKGAEFVAKKNDCEIFELLVMKERKRERCGIRVEVRES